MSKILKPSTLNKVVRKNLPPSSIRYKCSLNNTIYDVLKCRGWTEVVPEDDSWDFFWCDREWLATNYDKTYLPENSRISHFRNHFELTRKNFMVKNLKRYRKKLEKEEGKSESEKINFFPSTYELPMEYHMFLEEFKKTPGSIWIMKPVAKSQGKGIFLFKKLKDIEAWKRSEYVNVNPDQNKELPETYVVSRYIDKPYLICGRKFDLRIYVLVTSFNPLKAWIYRDGFARFSNTRFNMNSIDDIFIHLTNVAIQKNAPEYDPEKGCKWSIIKTRKYLMSRHGGDKIEKMFRKIDAIIIHSLKSVKKVIINDKRCFELYGYDILIDKDLKPWLLEINSAPSLTASNREDYWLKLQLLDDVLNVVDMECRLTGREQRIGGFDLLITKGIGPPCAVPSGNNFASAAGDSNMGVDFDMSSSRSTSTAVASSNNTLTQSLMLPHMESSNYTYNSFLGCEIGSRQAQLDSILPPATGQQTSSSNQVAGGYRRQITLSQLVDLQFATS